MRSAGRCRGLRGGEEPAAATPGLGQTRSGVHPGGKFVAPDLSPEYDGLEDSKPWSRKASIRERSDERYNDVIFSGLSLTSSSWCVLLNQLPTVEVSSAAFCTSCSFSAPSSQYPHPNSCEHLHSPTAYRSVKAEGERRCGSIEEPPLGWFRVLG